MRKNRKILIGILFGLIIFSVVFSSEINILQKTNKIQSEIQPKISDVTNLPSSITNLGGTVYDYKGFIADTASATNQYRYTFKNGKLTGLTPGASTSVFSLYSDEDLHNVMYQVFYNIEESGDNLTSGYIALDYRIFVNPPAVWCFTENSFLFTRTQLQYYWNNVGYDSGNVYVNIPQIMKNMSVSIEMWLGGKNTTLPFPYDRLNYQIKILIDGNREYTWFKDTAYADHMTAFRMTSATGGAGFKVESSVGADSIYYSHVKYVRCLKGIATTTYHYTNYNIPYVEQDVRFVIPIIDPYATRPYWIYWTWIVEDDYVDTIFVGDAELNWTYDYKIVKTTIQEAHYYVTEFLKAEDWGDWGWAWNWLRNGLCGIVNGLIGLWNILGYLLALLFNTLIMGIILAVIVPFVWNFLIYWIFYALQWVAWSILRLIILIGGILPIIIFAIAMIFAYIVSAFIWVLTLGTIDFFSILAIVSTSLTTIATYFVSMLYSLFEVMPVMFSYIIYYFIILGFAYIKFIYVKARGFVNRAEQTKAVYQSYLQIYEIGRTVMHEIKNMLTGWI
ncbi:MAG TPA: hypothetical protein VGB37_17475 [Candidatus Lokiarchaeia archaeon]